MAILTDEKLLRTPCVPVEPGEITNLINLLDKELEHSKINGRPGIGLSLPQIGIFKSGAIVRAGPGANVNLVNCHIEKAYDKVLFDGEGCLSFPNRYEKTLRYQEVYVVENAVEPYSFICEGLMAVVVQHELDHLVGRLLPDVALPKIFSPPKVGPNDLCPCGSNKKYKKCCGKF